MNSVGHLADAFEERGVTFLSIRLAKKGESGEGRYICNTRAEDSTSWVCGEHRDTIDEAIEDALAKVDQSQRIRESVQPLEFVEDDLEGLLG